MATKGTKMLWNSSKGYSLKDEVVQVLDHQGGLVHIESQPDAGEGSEPFDYWVPESELSAL